MKLDTALGHLQREENEKDTNGDASVKTGRQNVIVPHPPAEVVSAHKPLEDEADQNPGGVVDPRYGGYITKSSEQYRDVDVPPVREGKATSKIIERDG